MTKRKIVQTAIAIRNQVSLAARAFQRLEGEAERVLNEADASRSIQMVADGAHVSALIKAPGLTVRFETDRLLSICRPRKTAEVSDQTRRIK